MFLRLDDDGSDPERTEAVIGLPVLGFGDHAPRHRDLARDHLACETVSYQEADLRIVDILPKPVLAKAVTVE